MKLAESTWQDVREFDREMVCLVPTGSLEQHGPHLPLFTDSLLAGGVAALIEAATPKRVLLYPTVWLGCSAHHMEMDGSATARFETYVGTLIDIAESAMSHGFRKVLILNGHGGNTEPNGMAMRELKASYPEGLFAHANYYQLMGDAGAQHLKGPLKTIRHACEAEASMMLHLHPDLVRVDKLRDDGLVQNPPTPTALNIIQHFHEISDEGSLGYATYATAETGKALIELAVEGGVKAIDLLYEGFQMSRGT